MARMIPPVIRRDAPPGEHRLFDRLRRDPGTDGWIILHSLHIAQHLRQVEGEVDFVVIVPKLGVLFIEVKSHLGVRRDQMGQWHLGNHPPTSRSPFVQVSEAMHSLMGHLRQGRMDLKNIPFWSAVWFTNASATAVPASPEWHYWQLLDRDQLLRQPVSKTISAVLVQARRHLDQTKPGFDASLNQPTEGQCAQLAAKLRPQFEVAISPADITRLRDQERVEFLEEQYEALDLIAAEPRVLFTGAAGTGKTFLALEAARRASMQGRTVRLVCYNHLLGAWLYQQLHDVPGVLAGTLHRAMLAVASITPPHGANHEWWSKELPDLALEALLSTDEQADLLIVDDMQDLCTPEYLDVLDLMLRNGRSGGDWLMFGDFERQAIYECGDGRSALSARSASFFRPILSHNCRNTPRIGQAAAQLAGLGSKIYKAFRRPDDGINVEYVGYSSPAQQELALSTALDLLQNDHYPPDQIAVISARAQGVASQCVNPALRNRLKAYDTPGKKVGYTTIHAFKGLDAPAIVVTDIEAAEGPEAEALLYVALSRGTDRLVVLASNDAMSQMARNLGKGSK